MLLSYAAKETWVIKFYFFDCSQSVLSLFIQKRSEKNNNTHAFSERMGCLLVIIF